MTARIFISYEQSDRDLVIDLRARLANVAEGIMLVSPELGPGQSWSRAVLSELKKSDEILVLLTSNSLQSSNVLLAMGAAIGLQKKIVPIVVGLDEASLPGWIRSTPFIRYSELNARLLDLVPRSDDESVELIGPPTRAGVS